jgi:hypothetical protein
LIKERIVSVNDVAFSAMGYIIAVDAWVKAREHTHGKK